MVSYSYIVTSPTPMKPTPPAEAHSVHREGAIQSSCKGRQWRWNKYEMAKGSLIRKIRALRVTILCFR